MKFFKKAYTFNCAKCKALVLQITAPYETFGLWIAFVNSWNCESWRNKQERYVCDNCINKAVLNNGIDT